MLFHNGAQSLEQRRGWGHQRVTLVGSQSKGGRLVAPQHSLVSSQVSAPFWKLTQGSPLNSRLKGQHWSLYLDLDPRGVLP